MNYTERRKRKKYIKLENFRKIPDEKIIEEQKNTKSKIRGRLVLKDRDTGKILLDKDNLILWVGREVLLQKLLMKNRDPADPIDYKNLGLYWVSFGTGESDPADPLAPLPPSADQTGLVNEIILDSGNPNLADGGKKLGLNNVEFVQDDLNGNSWLICKISFTLDYNMGNGNDINAACMWLSDSSDPTNASVFVAFSKITFTTERKDDTKAIDFEWYFYF